MFAIRVQFSSERVRSCQGDGNPLIHHRETRIKDPADIFRSEECTISNAPLRSTAGLSSGPQIRATSKAASITLKSLPKAFSTFQYKKPTFSWAMNQCELGTSSSRLGVITTTHGPALTSRMFDSTRVCAQEPALALNQRVVEKDSHRRDEKQKNLPCMGYSLTLCTCSDRPSLNCLPETTFELLAIQTCPKSIGLLCNQAFKIGDHSVKLGGGAIISSEAMLVAPSYALHD
jgi:hypothetical protein